MGKKSDGRKSEKKTVEFEASVSLREALDYLQALHDALEGGTAYLRHGKRVLELRPGETVEIEVEGEEKGDTQSVEIEIKWTKPAEAPEPVQAPFAITVEPPVIEEEESDEDEEEDEGDEDEDRRAK